MDSPKRCAARIEWSRASCSLPFDHVKTAEDWHEVTATVSQHQSSDTHSIETETTEHIRWAPHHFEVPRSKE